MSLALVDGAKVDLTGESVRVGVDGFVRLDNMQVCRRIVRDGKVFLQFRDYDRMRSQCRGTRLIEIPLEVFESALSLEGENHE